MIAALFVEKFGIYREFKDVDMWTVDRDARKYPGPYPVIAHPPCERWCGLARANQSRYGLMVGDDGGCFISALRSVQLFGGILEHPAYSLAWNAHFLLRPVRGKWTKADFGYWVTEISQSAYGHLARKRTWLLYVGDVPPPDMDWSEPAARARISKGPGSNMDLPQLASNESNHTPYKLAEVLVSIARNSELSSEQAGRMNTVTGNRDGASLTAPPTDVTRSGPACVPSEPRSDL